MENLTLNEYQKRAMSTCMPSSENFGYMFLNLVGEVGEFASKVAKAIRKEQIVIDSNKMLIDTNRVSYDFDMNLQKEAGDILWQLSGLCKVMGWTLEDIARLNLDKLAARKVAGTIDGDGDGIYNRK